MIWSIYNNNSFKTSVIFSGVPFLFCVLFSLDRKKALSSGLYQHPNSQLKKHSLQPNTQHMWFTSCGLVEWGLNHVLTAIQSRQGLLSGWLRPHLSGCLGYFGPHPRFICCILTCLNKSHQEGKLIRLYVKCENTQTNHLHRQLSSVKCGL